MENLTKQPNNRLDDLEEDIFALIRLLNTYGPLKELNVDISGIIQDTMYKNEKTVEYSDQIRSINIDLKNIRDILNLRAEFLSPDEYVRFITRFRLKEAYLLLYTGYYTKSEYPSIIKYIAFNGPFSYEEEHLERKIYKTDPTWATPYELIPYVDIPYRRYFNSYIDMYRSLMDFRQSMKKNEIGFSSTVEGFKDTETQLNKVLKKQEMIRKLSIA